MPFFYRRNQKLFYREQGQGPLLILLPGNTASSVCYAREMNYFSQYFHVVVPDLPGTGQSDHMEVWPDSWWEDGAHAAAELVRSLGEETCIAMGSSGGGVCALLMAMLYPEIVKAVVADSCVSRLAPAQTRNVLADREESSDEMVAFWQYAHGKNWQQVIQADSDLLRRFTKRGGEWFDGRLRQIRCPVLFTASLGDSMLPDISSQVFEMSRQVRASQVFLIREGDHPLMWTCPEDFRCACDSFFESVWVGAGMVLL